MKTPPYFQPLQKAFHQHANAENAMQMKKYMKDRYDFFGVKSPLRKEIFRQHLKGHSGIIPTGETALFMMKWCWEQPQREFQYVAMELLQKTVKKDPKEIIELYEYLITNKSWWDTIDFIASNLVGVYFKRFPEQINPLTQQWMQSGNMWLQRTCLLFQLKYKAETDTELLHQFINQLSDSKEFFIRKAIGWILREYSKTNPDFVIDYVEKYPLSGLSHREALKWLSSKI